MCIWILLQGQCLLFSSAAVTALNAAHLHSSQRTFSCLAQVWAVAQPQQPRARRSLVIQAGDRRCSPSPAPHCVVLSLVITAGLKPASVYLLPLCTNPAVQMVLKKILLLIWSKVFVVCD